MEGGRQPEAAGFHRQPPVQRVLHRIGELRGGGDEELPAPEGRLLRRAPGLYLDRHWNGSSWAIVSSPNPPGPPAGGLAGGRLHKRLGLHRCRRWGRLTPAGSPDGASTLAEHWNGSAWSIVRSPSPSANSGLNRVACISAADCMAVGGFGDLDNPQSPSVLVEHWDGSAWSLVVPAASK